MLESLTLTDWKLDQVDTYLLEALNSRRVEIKTEEGHARVQLNSLRILWIAVRYPE